VMFFLTLNALTAGAFDSIDIALLYLQVLSTIQVSPPLVSCIAHQCSAVCNAAPNQHGPNRKAAD
jgi:hypothetical protein